MKRTYLLLLVFFLILIPIISATPITKISQVDLAMEMINGFPQKCYEEQGGNLLFIPEKFKTWIMSKTSEESSTSFWELFKKEIAMSYCNKKSAPSCIEDTTQRITIIPSDSNIKDACEYAFDKNVCEKCVADKNESYNEKQQMKKYIENGILIFIILIISFSFLYLIFSGIFYLIKKRLPNPRWLFFLALISFIVIIVILIIIWGLFVQVMY